MRLHFGGLVVCSIVAGCTRAATPASTPPSVAPVEATTPEDEPAEPEAPAVSTADLINAIEFVGPGGDDVWMDYGPAVYACDDAEYPETLDAKMASELGPYSLGARLSIVHDEGLAEPNVVAVHCHAPEGEDEDEMGMAQLSLSLSLSVPSPEHVFGLTSESFLMVVGLRVNPKAGLRLPEAKTDVGAAVRDTLLAVATEETAHIADECAEESDSGEPVPSLTDAAIKDVQLWAVAGRDGAGSFASFHVERCEQETRFGVLLDPKGRVVKHWATNNDVSLQWITDLDGDGDDEFGLRNMWLEDGMEEISIEYRDDGVWKTRMMYVSDSP